ncbi:hypothetical protein DFQ28_003598 [Apophysomyces sp. BC1034]|nr:hypothetical protein DFQ30_003539 [Apophysomyces sp. BC1015]KAG0175336.1 hypothetical protein DFQ29_007169 [Apophysomyces sp. BC1021]KAG0189275.1 hypothetical protein DFQ28_003598 [Apophysomyces sp. BC1034]
METNKDEAIRCLSIAKNHYGNGNFSSAVKLTKKSISLYSTDEAKAFLVKAENQLAQQGPSTTTSTPQQKPSEKPIPEKKYSPDQANAVKEVLQCGTDYYKVLKLDKDCSEVQIKKQYRKLALQFHPDKNNAPGADEAFKLISKSFTVLSDPQKRAIHDAGGGDPEQRASSGPAFSGFRTQSAFGGEDISPEDLFNMFFGGNGGFGGPGFSSATFVGPGFRTQTYYTGSGAGRRAHPIFTQQRGGARQASGGWTILLQILPLLVLFGYSLLSGLFTDSTPEFSFKATSVYSQARMTQVHQVPYYVNPSAFGKMDQSTYKLARIEQQIELDWVRGLQQSCEIERRERANRLNAASGIFGIGRNEEKYQAALRLPMKHCEEIKRFGYNPDYQYV